MTNAMQSAVLVLNASYEPINICGARRALVLVVKNVADIEEHTGRRIRDGIMFPSVIRLCRYRKVPMRQQVLSRKNIYLRDRHTCQYCGRVLPTLKLTLDHVVPRAQGGTSTWDNLVACCSPCNRRKADRTPEEAQMTLLHIPRPMTLHTGRHLLRTLGANDEQWKKYLYY